MADMMNYEEYAELLKKEITVMVTKPDPADGHTHVAYVDKNGNGMTAPYPEYEEEMYSHHHLIVDNNVVPNAKGWSISFHQGLQEITEAQLKETKTAFSVLKDQESKALEGLFKDELKGDDK